jgi:23S rRNA (adenine2503-C2)-methyltransferase
MKILRHIKVPTGDILVGEGEEGKVEFISVGDYGKEKNIKADFLNLSREIEGVPHGDLLPLTKKWVITISTQYGCSMGCQFCDVPKVGPGRNVSGWDMLGQISAAMRLHPEITHTERLNIHFARMGEPTFNPDVLHAAKFMVDTQKHCKVHPVVSTMMPARNKQLDSFLWDWMDFKNNHCDGEAGLQLSINTTDPELRHLRFGGNAHTLAGIADIMKNMPHPTGRKISLNFALTRDPVDADVLLKYFDPDYYLVKITPMHETQAVKELHLETEEGYTSYVPYREVENACKKAGYDVIVFIPSREEDESRITCGNVIMMDK